MQGKGECGSLKITHDHRFKQAWEVAAIVYRWVATRQLYNMRQGQKMKNNATIIRQRFQRAFKIAH